MKTLGLFLIVFLFSNTLWNAQETENLLCDNSIVQEELITIGNPPAQLTNINNFPAGKIFGRASQYSFTVTPNTYTMIEWECEIGGTIIYSSGSLVQVMTDDLIPPLYLPAPFVLKVRVGNEYGWSPWLRRVGMISKDAMMQ